MRFSILGSGSSGNSALLVTDQAKVLVDVGFSARRMGALLSAVGCSLEEIDAVFLTHEHGDHAGGIAGLKKFPRIRVFANAATARAVQAGLDFRPEWQYFETGSRFSFQGIEVQSFAVPHDAQEPVGYRFTTGFDDDLFSPRRTLTFLSDMGHAPQNVREQIRGCNVLVVEANHCPELLKADLRRPWPTKQRISGRHGHLSNEAVRALLTELACPEWRRVFLTHLSRECNTRAAVELALADVRARVRTCEFSIVGPGESTPLYECA